MHIPLLWHCPKDVKSTEWAPLDGVCLSCFSKIHQSWPVWFVWLLHRIVLYLRVRIVEFDGSNFKLNFKLQGDRWINRMVSAVAFTGLNTEQPNTQQVIISNQSLSLGQTDSCYLLLLLGRSNFVQGIAGEFTLTVLSHSSTSFQSRTSLSFQSVAWFSSTSSFASFRYLFLV